MLYSVLVQGSLLVAGAFLGEERLNYIKKENPNFGQVMMESSSLSAVLCIFVSAVANLPESSTKAQYVSSWTDYQVTKPYKLRITNKR
jgi:hypothetical protein